MAVYVHNFPAKVGFFMKTLLAIIKVKVETRYSKKLAFISDIICRH